MEFKIKVFQDNEGIFAQNKLLAKTNKVSINHRQYCLMI